MTTSASFRAKASQLTANEVTEQAEANMQIMEAKLRAWLARTSTENHEKLLMESQVG